MLETALKPFDRLAFWLKTLYLFPRSDIKTVLIPMLISAGAISPPSKWSQPLGTAVWIWFHMLQCSVSNQKNSKDEDLLNKPWRPLPSGRISQAGAHRLRWAVCLFCLGLSACYGRSVAVSSAVLSLVTVVHDDVGFSNHFVLKNLMNMAGYVAFEAGATMIMSSKGYFDEISLTALLASGLLIFTTIHAQDFQDVEGDKQAGRRTLPIVAPEGSRLYTLAALPFWSIALAALWELGPLSASLFLVMGAFVGGLYFRFRDVKQDETSYVLYNVWLVGAHILPLNAHLQVLNW